MSDYNCLQLNPNMQSSLVGKYTSTPVYKE